MSKIDITTQDIFLRLGVTSQSRSAKADALFRRLRLDQQDRIADAFARAPKRIEIDPPQTIARAPGGKPKKPKKRPLPA